MTVLRQRMLDDVRIRNYAASTVECYIRSVAAPRFFYRDTLRHKIDVARDGRFLINAELDDTSSEPIHLPLNWRPPAKQGKAGVPG